MKRFCFLLIIVTFLAGSVYAQDRGNRQPRDDRPQRNAPAPGEIPQPELKTVNITGTLQFQKGSIVLASGDSVYQVPMLTRLTGFIDGLKEGKEVSVEGFEFRNFIHLTKLTVDGKSYDFPTYSRGAPPSPSGNITPNRPVPPGWGGPLPPTGPGGPMMDRGRNQPQFGPNRFDRRNDGPGRNTPMPNRGKNNRAYRDCCGWT
jgi:hypothetical protein